jgi:hypothetical protein
VPELIFVDWGILINGTINEVILVVLGLGGERGRGRGRWEDNFKFKF